MIGYKSALGDLRVLVQLGIHLIWLVNNLGSLKECICVCTFYSSAHTRVPSVSEAYNHLKNKKKLANNNTGALSEGSMR